MKRRLLAIALIVFAAVVNPVIAAETPRVEFFAPEGTVKKVRQVTARFSEPMVPFGDPRLIEPFEVDCAEKGTSRWADSRNWAFDFERDLPAGIACTFRLKADTKTLAGNTLSGKKEFTFTTGGPSVRQSFPYEGAAIDEDQIFLLGLDAPADPESVLRNVYCDAAGVSERVPVRFVAPEVRRQILESRRDFVDRHIRALLIRSDGRVAPLDTRDLIKGSDFEKFLNTPPEQTPIMLLQCERRLPNASQLRLVWGAGVRTASGIATTTDQALAFRVREEFRANFHCERVNADADCIPILPLSLSFSSPVTREQAAKVTLKGPGGKLYKAMLSDEDGDAKSPTVQTLAFSGPFPEKAGFTFSLPDGFQDEAGRALANRDIFPLPVRTADYPPLAKFPARFGIIELNADATLPVTVRNIEAQLDLNVAKVAQPAERAGLADRLKRSMQTLLGDDKNGEGSVQGRIVRVWKDPETEVVKWLQRLQERDYPEGARSLFDDEANAAQRITLPRPQGARAFEVIGIPLKEPGFYVVELASPRLGAALLDKPQPYYVQTTALVTNLAVHFKRGRESSLVWVTTLDKGMPVAGADVEVRDCSGTVYFKGKTNSTGVLPIAQGLPNLQDLSSCTRDHDRKFLITARTDGDFSFAFSDWNQGINAWRFQLPTASYEGPNIATSIFDRTLLRAGETVHMKHVYRRHAGTGFNLPERERLPEKLVIRHLGSDEKYEQALVWDDQGIAESTWAIPQDAKLGTYQVTLESGREGIARKVWQRVRHGDELPSIVSGSFRVEAFRVPTMRAVLKPLQTPLVNAERLDLDVQLSYLAGGGASGAPVKLRGLVQPRPLNFPDYERFVFANGNVKEGIQRRASSGYFSRYEADESDEAGESAAAETPGARLLATRSFELDQAGAARASFDKLPRVDAPHTIQTELQYQDANGETLTASTSVPLWPARVIVGLRADAWAATKDKLRFHALALDVDGKPRANVPIKLDLLQRQVYSHRKRLVGGFYAYEHYTEIKRLRDACDGRTDAKGLLVCEFASPVAGNVIVRARATDDAGNHIYANQDVWVSGKDEWWFDVSNDDRMDVLPEKKRYEPGDVAVFQVRMPFREATALVTVEREGVLESFVTKLSGKEPVVKVPLKGNYAPNVFVSVLAVRGRVGDVQPTALVDLGKPAFKLGIAEINVGWRAHELKVEVLPERSVYKVRDTARARIKVRRADSGAPVANAEIALAAVDEGLLELMPNESWKLLEAMMQRRGIEVETATAQMHVIGKRHYGRKALAPGGGGGRQVSRELFDTLLLWKGRLLLDANGEATVDVPLNDSLTSFRLVAVATAGSGMFGAGEARVRSTQDLMLLSGLPPLVREQDRFRGTVTVRNASDKSIDATVKANARAAETEGGTTVDIPPLAPQTVKLAPGTARVLEWELAVPVNTRKLQWEFVAESAGSTDRLKIPQQVIPAVRVRTFQATLMQLDKALDLPVEIPADAIRGRGGIKLGLRARLAEELSGVREYMGWYPYSCLEQRASKAIALRDESSWRWTMNSLPAYLDSEGLAKYFPLMDKGSDTLTSYVLAIAHEAGWEIPADARERMLKGLTGFVQGRVGRYSSLPTADLTLRKLAALNAIARYRPNGIEPALLGSITIDPNLWPTSAVLDWLDVLKRSPGISDNAQRRTEAEQILRARLNFQGTTMGFSTERADMLWWLMISGDSNANRVLLSLLDSDAWRDDIPRLVRGTLGRQHQGHWNTTVANAWGVLAIEKFSKKFESDPVKGTTAAALNTTKRSLEWARQPNGGTLSYDWPSARATLKVEHAGGGKPWLTIQSLAAIPLKEAFSTGYRVKRTVTPVEKKLADAWSRGDVYRVRLELEAQTDMTWVVVHDPIPSGSSILGTGLGRDSQILTRGEKRQGWVWPAFEERTFDSFRAYYEFVPKGSWSIEYTVRLNTSGRFELPETRVEALYAPEMFGEIPNAAVEVKP